MNQFDYIRDWAEEKGILAESNLFKQFSKLLEEVNELLVALTDDNQEEVVDAVGDCVVVLTILAEMRGLNIEDCIASAYDVIKDRKGKMIDGTFVKEEDLK